MKKIFNIMILAGILTYMFIALSFTASLSSKTVCIELRINLFDTLESGFCGRADIERVLLGNGNHILGYRINEINTRELERQLMKIPYIRRADIYSSVDGVLRADIIQRKPMVRIITPSQNSYYLDEDGYILPAKGRFTPHILVANGNFTEDSWLRKSSCLDSLLQMKRYAEWEGALKLAAFISGDEFWNAQIVQLYYNRDGDFELIPRVGAHQIIFGDMTNFTNKFKKLNILYTQGLKYEGWNNYEKINLKYKNQVICTKR